MKKDDDKNDKRSDYCNIDRYDRIMYSMIMNKRGKVSGVTHASGSQKTRKDLT